MQTQNIMMHQDYLSQGNLMYTMLLMSQEDIIGGTQEK